jgi:predicted nucleic acid-binding protein
MSPVQVVIDTNVLVSAWRSPNGCSYRLIASFIAGDDRWQWNVSTAALLEYEEVLRREGFDHDRVSRFLDDLAARANRTVIYFLSRPALLDADDDFLLDLAVAQRQRSHRDFQRQELPGSTLAWYQHSCSQGISGYDEIIAVMSTLTIEIEDEAKAIVERVASEHNLSPADFVRVAIAQSLARSLKDPFLEDRAARADGSGFRDFLASAPDTLPVPGDELL